MAFTPPRCCYGLWKRPFWSSSLNPNILIQKEIGSSSPFLHHPSPRTPASSIIGTRYRTLHSTPSNLYHHITSSTSVPVPKPTIKGPWDLTESKSLSPFAKAIQQTLLSILPNDQTKHDSLSSDFYFPMHITVSVSGGCDSVALLHACMEWLIPWLKQQDPMGGVSIHVVHFNHEQRGEESDLDAVFVQELCDSYGIPCHVQHWSDPRSNAGAESAANDSSATTSFSQDTARQWRRQFLMDYTQQQLLQRHGNRETDATEAIGVILTAHHRDDAMESLLLKALRGVHLFNLSGMKAISPLTSNITPSASTSQQRDQQQDNTQNTIYLVRPWLEQPKLQLKGFDKADILQYLDASNYTWRDDKSNDSNKYLRNRVRHELMPLLQDLTNGGLASRLDHWVQQSEQLRDDVQPRVQAHLKNILIPSTREPGRFVLDWEKSLAQTDGNNDDGDVSMLIRSQALYEWITNDIAHVQGQQALRDLVSHDTLQRVLHQLMEYPKNMEWTLQLGKGWNIVRKGNILQLKPDIHTTVESSNRRVDVDANEPGKVWGWKALADTPCTDRDTTTLDSKNGGKFRLGRPIQLQVPKEWIVSSCDKSDTTSCLRVEETTVAEYESMLQQETMHRNGNQGPPTDASPSNTARTAILFLPPWKSKGSNGNGTTNANKPNKLRSFLRRQGVSFADRDDTPILVGRRMTPKNGAAVTTRVLLAVQVPVPVYQEHEEDTTTTSTMEWIVHSDYVVDVPSSSNNESIPIVLEPPPPASPR